VIGPEDLEDSPPPSDEVEEEKVEVIGEVVETGEVEEVEEEVKEAEVVTEVEAKGDTEEPTKVEEVVQVEQPSAEVEEIATATVVEDDDPPLELLEPSPPPAAPAVEPAPVPAPVPVAAAAPEPAPAPEIAPAPVAAAAPAPAPEPAAASPPRPPVVATRPQITPARPAATLEEEDDEEDDDFDETLSERLIGLTEMFPQFVRTGSVKLVSGSWGLSKASFSFAKSAAWVVFSTATILFMPVMIETERLQLIDAQKAQKNQILLGPGVAQSGGPSLGPPPI